MVALVAALAVAGVGGTLAWLTVSHSLDNVFGIGSVKPSIEETFDEDATEKNDVYVTNRGTVDAYLRARVDIYWVDASGRIMSDVPAADIDYTITFPTNSQWIKGSDGYYYWPQPVSPGRQTDNLIDSCTYTGDDTDGRQFVCDIATQAIQANPVEAVQKAWGVTVGDGDVLTVPTSGEGE